MIRADGRYGLTVGLTLGFAGALTLAFSYKLGLAAGLVGGLTFAVTYGLAVAGSTWTRYHITVALTAARRRGPLQFDKFLDWAAHAGLLRVSGVSYQFRHHEMQDRLMLSDPVLGFRTPAIGRTSLPHWAMTTVWHRIARSRKQISPAG